VQPLAAWLVARPQNAILGLAATLMLPVLQIISGIIVVLLVLKHGTRLVIIECGVALAILALSAAVVGIPLLQVAYMALVTWVPAALLALLLRRSGSLTLTLQALGLVIAGVAVVIFGVIDDITEFARPVTEYWLELLRSSGLQEQAAALAAQPVELAQSLMVSLLWGFWVLCVLVILAGYRYRRGVDDECPNYGAFRDLDFGRVLATVFAVLSIGGFATGIVWLQNVAIVMLALFWLQGLAILHWAKDAGMLPLFLLIMAYMVLFMPVLSQVVIVGLAVLGYSDAWFGLRGLLATKLKNRDL
jgi:hypothetical protein